MEDQAHSDELVNARNAEIEVRYRAVEDAAGMVWRLQVCMRPPLVVQFWECTYRH